MSQTPHIQIETDRQRITVCDSDEGDGIVLDIWLKNIVPDKPVKLTPLSFTVLTREQASELATALTATAPRS